MSPIIGAQVSDPKLRRGILHASKTRCAAGRCATTSSFLPSCSYDSTTRALKGKHHSPDALHSFQHWNKANILTSDSPPWACHHVTPPSHANGDSLGLSTSSSPSSWPSVSPLSHSLVSHNQICTDQDYGKKAPTTAGPATPMRSSTLMPITNP